MSIKEMPHTTVEQVLRLRQAAVRAEEQVETAKAEALEEFSELMQSYAENAYENGYFDTGDAIHDMCDLANTQASIHRGIEEE